MALQNTLEAIGLTGKEAAVYLAVLELGEATVLQIAKKASVKRPTAYITLAELQEKGFVVSIPRGTTTLYQAIDPEEISRRFEEKVKMLKQALPEFKSLFNANPGKPKVRFYEGKKNILALYEDDVFRAKEIIGAVSFKDLGAILTREGLFGMLHILKSNGGAIRDLLVDSPEAHEYVKEKNRLALGETKFLPADFVIGIDILVYGNTVAMISPRNLIAVAIEDPAIAYAQRQFLEFLWKSIGG